MLMIHTGCPACPHGPWTLFMRMESFPICCLRFAAVQSDGPADYMVHEHTSTPRAYICRIAGPRLHFSAGRTRD